jgi:CHAD domain-containing protein
MGNDGRVESGYPREHLEHEAKLCVPPMFRVPILDHVAPGLRSEPPRHERLSATYFDTTDLALARCGITLRHRVGDGDGRYPWTLKVPRDVSASALIRTELTFEGPRTHPPLAAADLVRAHTRGRKLSAVAHLQTERTIIEIVNAMGEPIAEVVDDVVEAREGKRHRITFREIEVELDRSGAHGSRVLNAIVTQLVAAGAVASPPQPKLIRALGERATAHADVCPPSTTKRDWNNSTAGVLVERTLQSSIHEMIIRDLGVRLDTDPEDLHAYRVATRRLRSNLRTFSKLLDPEWAHDLRAELGWIGTSLGAVRNQDVLAERLKREQQRLPGQRALVMDSLLEHLDNERSAAHTALLADMRSPRYDRLIERLVAAANHPCFDDTATNLVHAPATTVGLRLVRRTWRSLDRAISHAGRKPTAEALHTIRIRAKRCRYAVETLIPRMGKPAERLASRIAALQGVLGELNDSVAAERWLLHAGELMPRSNECIFELIAIETDCRAKYRREWRRLAHRVTHDDKLVRWMQHR